MEPVDDVAAGDHLGGGEVFEGLVLGGVVRVDSAVDPDAEEVLGLGGLDRAAYGRVGPLPPGEGVDLVRVEDVEARGDGVRVAWSVTRSPYWMSGPGRRR
ncbi:hypothetical protein [Streptomyces sp. NPDC085540]|uniref:hypothetical protein n=1 Tax=Streptomyces sp. NPDC085540 TaxID=3365730 RepID=UPI0037D02314